MNEMSQKEIIKLKEELAEAIKSRDKEVCRMTKLHQQVIDLNN